jgi:ferredoxin
MRSWVHRRADDDECGGDDFESRGQRGGTSSSSGDGLRLLDRVEKMREKNRKAQKRFREKQKVHCASCLACARVRPSSVFRVLRTPCVFRVFRIPCDV